MKIDDIQTPALLADLAAMKSNLNRMADFFRDKSVKLKPHFKPGEPALRLAKSAVEKGLRFLGIMGYDGHLQVLPAGPSLIALSSIAA